jgi:MFS family permease
VVALVLVAGIGTALWRPAVKASVPSLTGDSDRSAATAAYGACTNLGMTAGPGLAAIALMVVSPCVLLAANGITFAISAVLLSTIPITRRCGPPPCPLADVPPPSERSPGLAASLRSAVRVPGALAVLTVSAASTVAGAMMTVAEPLLAQGSLRAGGSGYAVLIAVYGVGMLTASVLCARLPRHVPSLRRWWLSGIALSGLALAGSGFAPVLAIAAATFALTGAGNMLTVSPEMRLVQELTPDHLLGQMFGLSDALSNIAFVAGFLLSGVVLSAVGVRSVFWAAGAITVALALAGALAFRRARSAQLDASLGRGPERQGRAYAPLTVQPRQVSSVSVI